jgi:hypothetical protein
LFPKNAKRKTQNAHPQQTHAVSLLTPPVRSFARSSTQTYCSHAVPPSRLPNRVLSPAMVPSHGSSNQRHAQESSSSNQAACAEQSSIPPSTHSLRHVMMAVRFAKEALVCLSNHGRSDFFGPSLLAPTPLSVVFSCCFLHFGFRYSAAARRRGGVGW